MLLFNPAILSKWQQLGGDDMFWFVKVNIFIELSHNAILFH